MWVARRPAFSDQMVFFESKAQNLIPDVVHQLLLAHHAFRVANEVGQHIEAAAAQSDLLLPTKQRAPVQVQRAVEKLVSIGPGGGFVGHVDCPKVSLGMWTDPNAKILRRVQVYDETGNSTSDLKVNRTATRDG
jgi:hypothetical protein